MSRRLNRDPLPLHKPEACSNILRWPDLARGSYLHSMVTLVSLTVFHGNVNEMILDLRGHTYCCGSESGSFHQ